MSTITNYIPGWNGGANTVATINQDGYFTFQLGQRTGIAVGLSKTVCGGLYNQIEHAFLVQGNSVSIYERGVKKYGPTILTVEGMTFKIQRTSGVVKYYLNNVLLYTSLIASTGIVWLDAAFYAMGDEIINAVAVNEANTETTVTGTGGLRFSGAAIEDIDGAGVALSGFSFASSASITDLITANSGIRFSAWASDSATDYARTGIAFKSVSNDLFLPDVSYSTPYFRFYSNSEALTDYAGSGEGKYRFSSYASDSEFDSALGYFGFAGDANLASTVPALLWGQFDAILQPGIEPDAIQIAPPAFCFAPRLVPPAIQLDPFDPRQAVPIYRCILTGAPDNLPDVELPISSMNARRTAETGQASYLSVTVPNPTSYAAAITARPNGMLTLLGGFRIGRTESLTRMFAVPVRNVRYDYGAQSGSLTIDGTAAMGAVETAKAVTLDGINYYAYQNGLRRHRVRPDWNLAPGDTATIGGETYTVGVITYTVSPRQATMEVAEATS